VADEGEGCEKALADLLGVTLRRSADGVHRYPHGVDASSSTGDDFFQFGFESEYTVNDINKLVKHYGPDESFGISLEQWEDMRPAVRAQWVRDHMAELFPTDREPGKLVRLASSPDILNFLPDRLIRDETGNIEIILEPVDTFEDWYRHVKKLNKKLGEGSMQGTVSQPTKTFFRAGGDGDSLLKERIGMFNFYSDYDVLQKLKAGYYRFEMDPSKKVARSFEHPFLGPMTRMKQRKLIADLKSHASGYGYGTDDLSRVSGSDDSYKYVGSTAYRPDIVGEERVVTEARDAHKNFGVLSERMLRSLYLQQSAPVGLSKFNKIKHFNSKSDFKKLPKVVRDELERLFPNKAQERFTYTASQKLALDVFRNFAYPMRDWDDYLDVFEVASLRETVLEAQAVYKNKLSDIVTRLRRSSIDDLQAQIEIQGALATFVKDSKLAKAFEDYQEQVVFGGARGSEFDELIHKATLESGPMKRAFPNKVMMGKLSDRMEAFASKYPNFIRKVKNVKQKFEGVNDGRTDLYVISLRDASSSEKEKFSKDYIKYLSHNTISFPNNESAGHLYTRLGNKRFDFYFGSDAAVNDFDPAYYSNSIEPFVELEGDEFMRLREYMENSSEDGRRTLGDSGYQGVNGQTGGQLDDNRPLGSEKHNCTSWICTAPIGDGSDSLHDLVGAPRHYEYHTNPGWWLMYLMNRAPKERMPFAVYYSDESLDDAISELGSNPKLNWNFAEE
jgi:predicted component of type VI protein secretion system